MRGFDREGCGGARRPIRRARQRQPTRAPQIMCTTSSTLAGVPHPLPRHHSIWPSISAALTGRGSGEPLEPQSTQAHPPGGAWARHRQAACPPHSLHLAYAKLRPCTSTCEEGPEGPVGVSPVPPPALGAGVDGGDGGEHAPARLLAHRTHHI